MQSRAGSVSCEIENIPLTRFSCRPNDCTCIGLCLIVIVVAYTYCIMLGLRTKLRLIISQMMRGAHHAIMVFL